MSYKAEIYNVMLASPGDVNEERQIAREIIIDWNNIHAAARKIVLLPLSWEYNSIPSMGDRPQGIINEQVLKNADILVGIFWTRIGTPTGKAISGSVEEIEEHIESGKPTMLYFSKKPVVPDSIDAEQYKAVTNLKKEYQTKGLTTDFDSLEDFRTKFQRHLSMKLNEYEYQIATTYLLQTDLDPDFNSDDIRLQLSTEAKILLKEASLDAAGEITKVGYMGGFAIETNGKQMNEDYSPRTKAKWEAAFNELLNFELISDLGYKGEYFQLTDKGYNVADKLD
jgi:hypothetical protein